VVPLSGGLDSRIIVAMLKRLGAEDVICFTYGKKGNREAEISRQVAEALGYRWYFVEYTKEKLYDNYRSDDMQRYLEYGGNLVSLPVIQDFLAVKELKEEGKIPGNAVIVPGHSGDMLAGSHIPLDYDQSQVYTFGKFLEDSLKKHYNLWKWDKTEFGPIFEGKIRKYAGDISVHDNESCANAIELFDFNERQAKFIINSVRAYEFFGYQWRIPLWDAELMDFFSNVDLKQRIQQRLYICFVRHRLFIDTLNPLFTIDCTTDLNVNMSQNRGSILRSLSNMLLSYSVLDLGWASVSERPLLRRISTHIKGIDLKSFVQYPLIGLMLINCNRSHSVSSSNGCLTLEFLKRYLRNRCG
jgi:asparagine synthase (glutamine-hydrolysing)